MRELISVSLPDRHAHREPAAALLQLLDSVLEPRSCAYAAGPLDSGREHYDRMASGERRPMLRQDNEARLTAFVRVLRSRLGCPVFDPGLLRIPGWAGRDYGVFFLEVISKYVRECWFADGWEYSSGATKEFVFCCEITMPCFAESGEPLTISEGARLIQEAAEYVHGLQLDDAKLRSRADDLRRMALGTAREGHRRGGIR